ncbi:MAG: hypothetical protein R3F48_01970 [Candidatus Zixiibacteriota bacterium]
MKRILILCGITLLCLTACSTENKPVDPTMLLNARFTGITYTDELGNIIGPRDSDDWHLYPGDVYQWQSLKPMDIDTAEGSILPSGYDVGPAYPNPFNGAISVLRFATPAATPVVVRIVNQEGRVVYTENRVFEAGAHDITWAPGIAWQNPEGTPQDYPDGIYRVYYLFDVPGGGYYSGWGDVWLTHGNGWWTGY